MKTCPDCGSTEIVSDLIVFADEIAAGQIPVYARLVEPAPAKKPFVWVPKSVTTGFRAEICGGCGYTRFHAANHAELLAAKKQGYSNDTSTLSRVKV